jgi:hypothetical protein
MATYKDKQDSYKKDTYPFPRHDIDPKLKQESWWMKAASEAIYSMYVKGKTYTSLSEYERIQENRLFMSGDQSPERYMNWLLGDVDNLTDVDFMRKGLYNIDRTPPAIAPKYVHVVKNMFEEANFEMLVNSLDEDSNQKKELKKWRLWVMKELAPQLLEHNQQEQMKVFDVPETLPNSIDELNFMEQIGSFRLAEEMAFEVGLEEVLDRCNAQEIKRKFIEDLWASGKGCIREFVNPTTQKVDLEWCDIARTIISYSNKDYTNPSYAAVIKDYSISEIMEKGGLTEDEAREIATMYLGYYDNPTEFHDRHDAEGTSGYKPWYDWKVSVMESEFESVDVTYKTKRKNSSGNEIVYDEPYKNGGITPKVWNTDKRKTTRTDVRTRYRACWVIGTDHTFDTGYQYDIPRPTPEQTGSSFHFYSVGKAFIEIIKPFINQCVLAFLRMQNAIANAPGSGFYIEYSSLQNIAMAGKNLKPLDIIKLGKTTGSWIYKATTHYGQINTNIGRPVEHFEGGVGRELQEYITEYQWANAQIQELIGLTPIAAAGSESRETTLGEQEIKFASSTNAVKHFLTAWREVLKGFAQNAVLRMKIIAKHNPEGYRALKKSIGYGNAEVLKISKAEATADMGIEIVPVLGAQAKQEIFQMALGSMQAGKSGGVGIKMSDFLTIKRFLEAGKIRAAENWLVYSENKEEKRQQALQEQNMTLNAETAQQTEQVKQAGKKDEIITKGEVQKDVDTNKANLEKGNKDAEQANDMIAKAVENENMMEE